MDYEKDIQIDESALDAMWLDQPSLMFKYAKNAAEMRRELDLAKEKLDLVKAELDKEIRTNPDKFGIEKITEAVVTNTMITTLKYKKANDEFLNVKYEVDVAQAAVVAMSQRKDALENLVRLHGQQYFAGPKVPHDISELRESRQKNVNKSITIKRSK